MAIENVQLRQERAQIAHRMKALSEKEVHGRGALSDAEKSEFGRLNKEYRELGERIERIEAGMGAHAEMTRTAPPPHSASLGGAEDHTVKEYRQAFGRYLKRGRTELTLEDRTTLQMDRGIETRDLQAGGLGAGMAGAAGGAFFVPVGFVRQVESAMKYYGPFLNGGAGYPTILDTETGQPLPYPTSNDTAAECELVGESQQVTAGDVSLGLVNFGAYKFSSKLVKVSLELIEDSAFDIEAFLVNQFAQRFGRGLNKVFIGGTGVSQPTGLYQALSAAGAPTVTAQGANTNDGVSGANTIGTDDLVSLEYAVDPVYRPGAVYVCHDTTLAAIRRVKDKFGRPLLDPSITEGAPATFNGYRVLTTPYMDQLQTSAQSPAVTKRTMLFGQLGKYTIRRVRQMSVLRLSERFADFGQVAFLAFVRYDGQLLDAGTHPLAQLNNVY